MKLGIGSTIWVFDVNRRIYDENRHMIWREQWRPMKITGETSRSWITSYGKYSKKGGQYLTSEQEIDKAEWVNNYKYGIVRLLEWCKDYDKVKAIAEILGSTDDDK